MVMHIILFNNNVVHCVYASSAVGSRPLDASPHALSTMAAALVAVIPKLTDE